MASEILLPFPKPIAPLTAVRSTVLLGSIAVIRESPHWSAYEQGLDPQHRETLLTSVAAAWLPVPVALAHYRACDALPLSSDEQVANGRRAFDHSRGVLFGTAVKMAKQAGATPWTLLAYFDRFWARGYQGGGVQVARVGPKEAHLDIMQAPLLEVRYLRNVMRGVLLSGIALVSTRGYMSERAGSRPPNGASYRIQWV